MPRYQRFDAVRVTSSQGEIAFDAPELSSRTQAQLDALSPTGGQLHWNTTTEHFHYGDGADTTFHSVHAVPIAQWTNPGITVANNTVVEFPVGSVEANRHHFGRHGGGAAQDAFEPPKIGSNMLIAVTAEWAANATGIRRVGLFGETGATDNSVQTRAGPAGVCRQGFCSFRTLQDIDAWFNIRDRPNVVDTYPLGQIAVFQNSGGVLALNSLTITFLMVGGGYQ